MYEFIVNLGYLTNRYAHIVAMTLLVGGTLFFETVLPIAIGDLRNEQQMIVFARARWVFKRIVVTCALILLASGAISTYRNWPAYNGQEAVVLGQIMPSNHDAQQALPLLQQPRVWFLAHVVFGLGSVVIALSLVLGPRTPDKPVRWMRLNLLLLFIAIFMASATRNARLRLLEGVDSQATANLRARE